MRIFYKVLLFLCLCFVAVVSGFIVKAINRPAEVSFISSSGNYKVEYVSAKLFFTLRDLAYLRVTELKHPDHGYRSPLISANSLEMSELENRQYVGVDWVRFDKIKLRFDIAVLGWRGSWVSFFISNTPYEVFTDE